jgi:hypothetical protein
VKTLGELPGWFSKQQLQEKLMIGGMVLLFLICLCAGLSTAITRLGQAPTITSTLQGADVLLVITWTPAGSLTPTASITSTSTPLSTRTPLPTSLPTRSFETATTVILPTGIIRPFILSGSVGIVDVNKTEEYVEIQNFGAPVNLNGWVLLSQRGEQSCELHGIIQTDEVLRIWAGTAETGYSCGFSRTIWTDNELDRAVLYNPNGQEVSRYPP